MLLKITLRHEAQGVTCTVMAKKIDEQLPGLHTLVATNAATGIVAVALPSQETLTEEQRHYLDEQWYIAAVETFTDAQDVPAPQPTVLFEDNTRRKIRLGSDYEHDHADTDMILFQHGAAQFITRNDRDVNMVYLTYAEIHAAIAAWQKFERDNPDVALNAEHPF